jgi:hypothetical protein
VAAPRRPDRGRSLIAASVLNSGKVPRHLLISHTVGSHRGTVREHFSQDGRREREETLDRSRVRRSDTLGKNPMDAKSDQASDHVG